MDAGTMSFVVVGVAVWLWVIVLGGTEVVLKLRTGHKRGTLTERERARLIRNIWKWVLWPIYLPIFLIVGAGWLIFKAVRGVIRSLGKMKLFKKLSELDNTNRL